MAFAKKTREKPPPNTEKSQAAINFTITKSASDIDLQTLRNYYAYVAIATKNSSRVSELRKEEETASGSTSISSSVPDEKTILRMKSEKNDQSSHDNSNKRKTIYDEEDYVVLNFQTFTGPGKDKQEKKALENPVDCNENANKEDNYITLSSNPADEFQFPPEPAVDECGYEIPMAQRQPTYMSLDSVSSPPPFREPPEPPNENCSSNSNEQETVNKQLAVEEQNSNLNYRKNWKKEAVRARKINSTFKDTTKFSSAASSVSTASAELKTADEEQDMSTKPISSFLSARLEEVELQPDLSRGAFCRTSSSNTASPSCTDQESVFDSEQWSDEGDFSPDNYGRYYQEVYPPDLSGSTFDHDYAVIVDAPEKNVNKKKRKKSMKKVKAFVNGKSKSNNNNSPNASLNTTPKLHRQKIENIKLTGGTGTWETVSTPGILTLNNYKDLNKNKVESSDFVTHKSSA